MTNRASLLVVAAAAIGLFLTGCGGGPGTDETTMMPDFDGTWYFTGFGFTAKIEGTAVEVTVGDGMMPLGEDPPYSSVTQIVVKGTLSMEGTAFKLTLSEEADAITVTPTAATAGVALLLRPVIETVQAKPVMITVEDDTMTVTGSFLDDLATALGTTVPDGGLKGCKGAPCMAS